MHVPIVPPQHPSQHEPAYLGTKMFSFRSLTQDEVRKLINNAPNKSCDLDPIPTSLIKECCDELLPAIRSIINTSLVTGVFPEQHKMALIRPLIKKQGADENELKSYRPVSNLNFISKLIERAVAHQLESHLTHNNLLDPFQSGYRAYHSTETAILKIVNDILTNVDHKKSTGLVSIDLSAAFDLVDHAILTQRLKHYFGIDGHVLKWFISYLSDRTQRVIIDGVCSDKRHVLQGVPQGSVLGARLYTLYTRPLSDIIANHGLSYHSYADDTQIYIHFNKQSPDCITAAIDKLELCVKDISTWMSQNGLKLNHDKTEFCIFNSNPTLCANVVMRVGDHRIPQSSSLRNLGVRLDDKLSFVPQISDVCRSSYYHLRRINKIRSYLSENDARTLVQALVSSRLDYTNSIYCGLPGKTTRKLQLAQNTAARVITKTKKYEHITPVLKQLHWLPINRRSEYKAMLLIYNALNNQGPSYISQLLQWYKPSRPLRSRLTPSLVPCRGRSTKINKRLLRGGCSTQWNNLPPSIRTAKSFSVFKTLLKTHYFNIVY